jgi:hypothetical protein
MATVGVFDGDGDVQLSEVVKFRLERYRGFVSQSDKLPTQSDI